MMLRVARYTPSTRFSFKMTSFSSKHFLNPSTSTLKPSFTPPQKHYFHICKPIFPLFCSKPISKTYSFLKTNGFSTAVVSPPVNGEDVVNNEDVEFDHIKFEILKDKLKAVGIDAEEFPPGQYTNLTCPMCDGGDSKEKSFSLHISKDGNSAAWTCFRAKCGWFGRTRGVADSNQVTRRFNRFPKIKPIREITEEELGLEPLCDELLGYFAERLITKNTLQRNHVMQRDYGDQIVIAFTYHRDGVLKSCKYRDVNKNFWQEKDTEKIFYGLDDIKGAQDVIIVEGEIDKLSMEEAGFRNCVSVPDGAPASISQKPLPPEDKDTKYQYLWNCKEYLKEAHRIIIATDGDPPGQALAEELARRLGRERCWRIKWPKKSLDSYCKDANEVLMHLGPDVLKEVIDNAELYPISGLFNFLDFFDEIDAYYHRTLGYQYGVSTGWRGLNEFYNVVPGELTVVTGVPNSGKSEWIDALLCNLNESVGWKFVLCSMENKVRDHARKLLEKYVRKPFFDLSSEGSGYAGSAEKMSTEELDCGKQWLKDTFYLIRCENDALPNIKWVLDLARIAVLRHGVRGLVIDPYNELDHQRPPNMTETEYVSQMLTMIKRFAQHHACHVWFVAHPRQLHNWVGGPPNMYDISGSAHFINKCDNGIVVHRNRDPDAGPIDQVQVCVRKVRNKVAGTIGEAFLKYDRVTGIFSDIGNDGQAGKRYYE